MRGSLGLTTVFVAAIFLASCSHRITPVAEGLPPPSKTDPLESPEAVKTGDLQYGDGTDLGSYDTFAPIITQAGNYPTQHQALHAFQRARPKDLGAYRIKLFACKPGLLDGNTGRIELLPQGYDGVHCATDLINQNGRVFARTPVNFYYKNKKWLMHDPETQFSQAIWINPEPTIKPSRARGKRVKRLVP